MLPTPPAQSGIGPGDLQTLGADHQPVQAGEGEAFRSHDVAVLLARGGGDGGGFGGQRERSDFDARVSGLSDGAAGFGERPFLESLIAHGEAEHDPPV